VKFLPCLVALSVLALGACSELRSLSHTGFAPVISRGHNANDWLSELYATREMSEAQLRGELASREEDFRRQPDNANRLRLVLLLAAGNEPVRDPQRARELLAESGSLPENPGDRELVIILRQFLDEQEVSELEIRSLSQQMETQSRRIEELEGQQKALTTIEQSIQKRDIPVEMEDGN